MEEKKKGYYREKKKCIDCGKVFTAKHPKTVRCMDCRYKHHLETVKKNNKARSEAKTEAREKKRKKKERDPNICKKIKSCYYGGYMGAERICDYLGKTGVRRPCKAGECYFYKRKGKERCKNDVKTANTGES